MPTVLTDKTPVELVAEAERILDSTLNQVDVVNADVCMVRVQAAHGLLHLAETKRHWATSTPRDPEPPNDLAGAVLTGGHIRVDNGNGYTWPPVDVPLTNGTGADWNVNEVIAALLGTSTLGNLAPVDIAARLAITADALTEQYRDITGRNLDLDINH